MRILEIENLFQSEETLNQVLDKMKEEFDKIDYWAGLMKQNITSNPEEAKKAINQLTGTFSNLKTVLAIADTEKKNREIRYYDKRRIEIENADAKFTSASVEREASAHVGQYRRVRNLIQAYTNSCEKSLSTLQSLLKYMGEELKLTRD